MPYTNTEPACFLVEHQQSTREEESKTPIPRNRPCRELADRIPDYRYFVKQNGDDFAKKPCTLLPADVYRYPLSTKS